MVLKKEQEKQTILIAESTPHIFSHCQAKPDHIPEHPLAQASSNKRMMKQKN